MPSPIWNIAVLFFVGRALCASDTITVQDSKQSLTGVAKEKIDENHIIFNDDEKTRKEGSSVYNRGQLESNERKQDGKRHEEQDMLHKGYDKGRYSSGESELADQGRNSFERHGNGYYKKGHRRTGFSNSYHKDESGNNSSFYEDGNDEGGQRSSGNSGSYYEKKSGDSFADGARDASYIKRNRAQQGMHNNRHSLNNYQDYLGDYNDDRYRADRRNYLRDDIGSYFGKDAKEAYYRRIKYHPIIDRNDDYMPSFGYPTHFTDTLLKSHYREDPYVLPDPRDYRYFPNWMRDYRRDSYYPRKQRHDRYYRDDFYDNEYINRFRNGYHRF